MGSEVRSLPKHPHWSRMTPATDKQPWERKRMKLMCVSFSSHGLCGLKHPACIQPGTRIVAKGHTHTESFELQGWQSVGHISPTKSQKYQVGPGLEPWLRGVASRQLGSVLQGCRAAYHSQLLGTKSPLSSLWSLTPSLLSPFFPYYQLPQPQIQTSRLSV